MQLCIVRSFLVSVNTTLVVNYVYYYPKKGQVTYRWLLIDYVLYSKVYDNFLLLINQYEFLKFYYQLISVLGGKPRFGWIYTSLIHILAYQC